MTGDRGSLTVRLTPESLPRINGSKTVTAEGTHMEQEVMMHVEYPAAWCFRVSDPTPSSIQDVVTNVS
jgi:hypothetical protein